MKSLIIKRSTPWRFVVCVASSSIISLLATSAILREPPQHFGEPEWVILFVSALLSAIFTYRETATRGFLAGVTTTVTLAIAMRNNGSITSAEALAFFLVLCANLTGLIGKSAIRFAGLSALVLVAILGTSYRLSLAVLAAGSLAILEAQVIEWAIPRFLKPIIDSKPYARYLLTFGLAFVISTVAFALIFNAVHLASPSGAFDVSGQRGASLNFGDFLYLSLFLMVAEGPPYPPVTTAAKFLVGFELAMSILLLVVYFSLLTQLFNIEKPKS